MEIEDFEFAQTIKAVRSNQLDTLMLNSEITSPNKIRHVNGKTIVIEDIYDTISPNRPFSAAVQKPKGLMSIKTLVSDY